MNIYSPPVRPYVYKCTEKETGKFYIGYRFKNTVPAKEDLGKHYFTSNDYVKKNFNNFDYEIVAEFPDRKSAFAFETKLIKETKGVDQINANKHNKSKKPYGKSPIYTNCFWCEKPINSSISKFCTRSHAMKYNANKKHKIEKPDDKSPVKPEFIKTDNKSSVKPNCVNLPKNYTISRIQGTKDSVMWRLKGFDI
jgi:hypothetical protein